MIWGRAVWAEEHTLEASAAPEVVWALWADVAGWPQWDGSLEKVELRGVFGEGSEGSLWGVWGGVEIFRIQAFQGGRSFTCHSRGLLKETRRIFWLEPAPWGVRITHRVECRGLLAGWFRITSGRRLRELLPKSMRTLARMAAERSQGDAGANS